MQGTKPLTIMYFWNFQNRFSHLREKLQWYDFKRTTRTDRVGPKILPPVFKLLSRFWTDRFTISNSPFKVITVLKKCNLKNILPIQICNSEVEIEDEEDTRMIVRDLQHFHKLQIKDLSAEKMDLAMTVWTVDEVAEATVEVPVVVEVIITIGFIYLFISIIIMVENEQSMPTCHL